MKETIIRLREEMKRAGVGFWLDFTSDDHGSEYISEHDSTVKFLSGFTGDNGILAVSETEACLWTDGRFFISGAAELEGSGITLMKSGEPGVPSVYKWLSERYIGRAPVAMDGNKVSCAWMQKLREACPRADIITDRDLAGAVWTDRPARELNEVRELPAEYACESTEEKLIAVRKALRESGADAIFETRLDNIAWLLNRRGSDIPYNTVFYGYMYVDAESCVFDTDKQRLIDRIEADGTVRRIAYDPAAMDTDTYERLSQCFKMTAVHDIIGEIKAVKSEGELAHTREAVLRDSAYLTTFIYRLKKAVGEGAQINELQAAELLDDIRRGDERFVTLSFPTISAYGPNAAIVHYAVTEESARQLRPEGLYLVDSGATYLDGTTDVTRTIALGPVTDEERKHYTLVMLGMLRLMNAKFPPYTVMPHLDAIARGPLWERGLDYNHGTGHGIGYVGCVHEAPVSIRRSIRGNLSEAAARPLPGIVCSDEPGVYIEGSHGIRIEDMITCVRDPETGWLAWENLTWVPLDPGAVDETMMTEQDIRMYRQYQRTVYEKIGPLVDDDVRSRLREVCGG